ncbi:hypothetical protein Tco_1218309 [Tanacetum coccineum]
MSTQQDIYASGFENRPPMLNKENYVSWSSRLLRYAKSRPNGKLIYNSIMNGPYVKRMIPEPGDPARTVPVPETFHEQTNDELTKAEIKQIEADVQAIQTILLSLPEDIYTAVDSCETAQEIWFTSTDGESTESYYHRFSKLMNDFKRNKHFPEKIASNLKFLNNLQPKWSRHVTIMVGGNGGISLDSMLGRMQYRIQQHELRVMQMGIMLLIAQKEEARIQLQAEEFDLMAAAADLDEIEEVNANCILMDNLQQASTSGTQTDKAPVYDSDGSAEVQLHDNCYNDEIFNMFTQEEQYIELLEPIPKPHEEKSTVSSLQEEKKRLKSDFKMREDELLDRQIQLENKIKELDNILVKTASSAEQQSLYNGKVLLEKHDPPTVHNLEETLELAQESQAAKFVQDFQSLAKEADESLAKHKALELDIERLLRAIITHLGDQKGKNKDNPCVSNTLDPLSQKLENENVELEFQIKNYVKENAHLKTAYKNLFDSINVTRTHTKAILDSLQNKLHDTIYENAKLRTQLFDKVFEQKDTTRGTSANTKFTKQSILGKPPSSSRPKLYAVTPLPKFTAIPKAGETNALSNQVTSNSVPSFQELKVVENDNVIALGIFRINPRKTSRKDNFVPNKHVKASVRIKPITVSQPHVITKNDVNSKTNGFSPKDIKSTTRTRRP